MICLRDFQIPDKVKSQDEMAPNKGLIASNNQWVNCQYKQVPFLDATLPVAVNPLTLEFDGGTEKDLKWIYYPKYLHEGKIYRDDAAWEICVGNNKFYIVVFDMQDPSYGLLGVLGSWTPYRTILFDERKEAISEHSEFLHVDPVRIKDCVTAESMIRHLTVWGMVKSSYGEEIRRLNEELMENYKLLIELEKRIRDIYCQREALDDSVKLYVCKGYDAYEYFLEREQ